MLGCAVSLLDPGPALFVDKSFRVAVRCCFPLSQFSSFCGLKQRLKFIVLLQKVCCVERAVPPQPLRRRQNVGFLRLLPRRRNLRAVKMTLGKENFVHVHDVMEGLLEVVSSNSVLFFFGIPPHGYKEVLATPRSLLDTKYDLRYFLFHTHGSTRVLGQFFIESQGFCDLKANAGNAKCWAWTARDRSHWRRCRSSCQVRAVFFRHQSLPCSSRLPLMGQEL